jgi:hypothetical protein
VSFFDGDHLLERFLGLYQVWQIKLKLFVFQVTFDHFYENKNTLEFSQLFDKQRSTYFTTFDHTTIK